MNVAWTYDEIMLNQWQPLQTILYDGWILRFADGYTKRANSIQPLYPSSLDIREKIRHCEELYGSHGQRTVFRLSSLTTPVDLDDILHEEGYEAIDLCSIQSVDLSKVQFNRPVTAEVRMDDQINDEWIEQYCELNSVEDRHKPTMKRMLSNRCSVKGFFTLYQDGAAVACGLGMVERRCLGLYDIVTHPNYRNLGLGEQLVSSILRWGRERGAEHATLAVLKENTPALRLYSKFGFIDNYEYWYRVK